MTYGRLNKGATVADVSDAAVSHPAELVRGNFLHELQGPLIRLAGTFSPRGEGSRRTLRRFSAEVSA
jgi:hypothetical protein